MTDPDVDDVASKLEQWQAFATSGRKSTSSTDHFKTDTSTTNSESDSVTMTRSTSPTTVQASINLDTIQATKHEMVQLPPPNTPSTTDEVETLESIKAIHAKQLSTLRQQHKQDLERHKEQYEELNKRNYELNRRRQGGLRRIAELERMIGSVTRQGKTPSTEPCMLCGRAAEEFVEAINERKGSDENDNRLRITEENGKPWSEGRDCYIMEDTDLPEHHLRLVAQRDAFVRKRLGKPREGDEKLLVGYALTKSKREESSSDEDVQYEDAEPPGERGDSDQLD